jgi:hypothetical protein
VRPFFRTEHTQLGKPGLFDGANGTSTADGGEAAIFANVKLAASVDRAIGKE